MPWFSTFFFRFRETSAQEISLPKKNGLSEHKTREIGAAKDRGTLYPGRKIATPDSVGILCNKSAHNAYLIMKFGAGKTTNEISPIFSTVVARYR
jgi:hypothetical protein